MLVLLRALCGSKVCCRLLPMAFPVSSVVQGLLLPVACCLWVFFVSSVVQRFCCCLSPMAFFASSVVQRFCCCPLPIACGLLRVLCGLKVLLLPVAYCLWPSSRPLWFKVCCRLRPHLFAFQITNHQLQITNFFMSFRTSLSILSTPNRQRAERVRLLSDVLEHGTEDDYLELLVGWGVPARRLEGLLNEFRRHRRVKRELLL